jgi:1-acyl-sn-glycerol-3-phosphate acyltransferase
MFYYLLKFILGPISKLIWVKRIDGLINIPKSGPVIIAANHQSYFDFLLLVAVCPRRIYFLAGEVFFKKWWWRPLVKWTGQIRVNRDQKDKSASVNKAIDVLKNEQVLGIFPEGTRSKDGQLQKAYGGVVKLALKANAPIIPVGISGTYQIMSRHMNSPKFFKIASFKFGEPIVLKESGSNDVDRLRLDIIANERVMSRIKEMLD